jgi:hypothetical protein
VRSPMTAQDMTIAAARRPAAAWRTARSYAVWALLIVVGLVLLYLRYDWGGAEDRYAERGFLLSAYLFVLTLPTSYYLTRRVLRSSAGAAVATGIVFVATTLPWHLLGLARFAYYADRARYFSFDQIGRTPAHEWLPEGTLRSFPYDWIFMPLVLATGVALIWGVWWLRNRGGAVAARTVPILLTAAFAAICLQTYLHTSVRAPGTYNTQFWQGATTPWWYVVAHFRDGSGAVEADQFVFTPLEEYFQGTPADGNNMLVRRPLSFYAVAQASYFINTFYVWIGLNCLFWLAAVVATGRWVGRVASPRAGVFAAALVTFGPGFVAWVGTTAMYLQAYAAVIIALCLFEDLVVRSGGRRRADVVLFSGALTLCMLIYDLLPLAVSLLAYGLARRVRARPLLLSLGASLAASRVFPLLVTGVLGIDIDDTNSKQLTEGLDAVKHLVLHPTLNAWYGWSTTLLPTFGRQLLQAFFVLPVLIAIVALPRLKDRALRILVAALFVTGFGVVAVLQIGHQVVGQAPRMVYPVFPAVCLLAALALAAIPPAGRLRRAAPWAAIAVIAVLTNIDIFGYPSLYVEHFTGKPASTSLLPR